MRNASTRPFALCAVSTVFVFACSSASEPETGAPPLSGSVSMVPAAPAGTAGAPPAAPAPAVDPAASSGESTGTPPLVSNAPAAEDDSESPVVAPDAGAPAPPATAESTRGSGGGLQYRINAPEAAGPHGLLVLLHGSTASNYETFVPMMSDVAEQYDLIPVSVLAPNGQGWNEGNQVTAAELLHSLVQDDLYAQYDIDTSRVLFSGQSSGGGFLASNFVPAHAKDYTGGAFLQCGAQPPNIPFAPDAATRQNFRLHFEITTEDPIWPEYYAAALVSYRDAGMLLTENSTKPGGHCQFDQQQVILDNIEFVLGR